MRFSIFSRRSFVVMESLFAVHVAHAVQAPSFHVLSFMQLEGLSRPLHGSQDWAAAMICKDALSVVSGWLHAGVLSHSSCNALSPLESRWHWSHSILSRR